MSVEAMSWALNHAPVSGTDKVVLLGIANHAHKDGTNAYPGIDLLVLYANVSERAVQQSLRRLEQRGLIVRNVNEGGDHRTPGNRRPNRYQVVMTDASEVKPPAPQEIVSGEVGCTPKRKRAVQPTSPQRRSRGEGQRLAGVKSSASRGEAGCTQIVSEPSSEPSSSSSSDNSQDAGAVVDDDDVEAEAAELIAQRRHRRRCKDLGPVGDDESWILATARRAMSAVRKARISNPSADATELADAVCPLTFHEQEDLRQLQETMA